MLLPVNLCLLFSLVAILLCQCSSDAISFDYPNFDGQNTITGDCPGGDPRICLRGNATVDNSAIFLTQDRIWQSGMAYYSKPVHLWDNSTGNLLLANFTTNFSFLITRTKPKNSGDGLAFFLFSHPLPNIGRSAPGGRLGLKSFNHSIKGAFVAVEIDTYKNEWDGPVPHVGIDNNSMISVESRSMEEYGSATNIKCKAFVQYYSSNMELRVSLMCDPDRKYTLSHAIDLRSIFRKEYVTVGFTGNTGGSTQTNQVSSWSFHSSLDDIHEESRREAPAGKNKKQKQEKKKKKKVMILVVAISLPVLFLLTLVVAIPILRQRIWPAENDRDSGKKGYPPVFSLDQIMVATCNFDEGKKLSVGWSGTIYRGVLSSLNCEVDIKRVTRDKDSELSKKECIAEVKVIISELPHLHLLRLLGWCDEKGEFLLVYELMPNLSLDMHLCKDNGMDLLSCNARYKISLQIASALLHLHEDCSQCIVHGNIKASNIMLDDAFNAKLGDFGLPRLTTAFRGTVGYIAPECFHNYRATIPSDVYAFGIVLLEIATGKMVTESCREGQPIDFVGRAWDLLDRGETAEEDERLEDKGKKMERLLFVGLSCAHPDPRSRPSIREALAALKFGNPNISIPSQRPLPIEISSSTPQCEDNSSCILPVHNHVVGR